MELQNVIYKYQKTKKLYGKSKQLFNVPNFAFSFSFNEHNN